MLLLYRLASEAKCRHQGWRQRNWLKGSFIQKLTQKAGE